MDIANLQFSVPEILSLIGLGQCVYLLVYIFLRSGDPLRALLPIIYFAVLGTAFYLDFGARTLDEISPWYPQWQWAAWFMGPPLGVLLMIQIAQISKVPALRNFWVLLLIPAAYAIGQFMARQDAECVFPAECPMLRDWLVITGLIAGTLSMLAITAHAGKLTQLHSESSGRDRYWLILMLVLTNLLFLMVMLLSLSTIVSVEQAILARTLLGLAFVYLAGTSLFRIYPQAVTIKPRSGPEPDMNRAEQALAAQIEQLLDLDKVYHEPSYSRADLARELETSETTISKVINIHFGKSFPQLLNERRVEDAKRMLAQTDVNIKLVAQEVGFNSTASFNRVFREVTGLTPSAYRNKE